MNKPKSAYLIVTAFDSSLSKKENDSRMTKLLLNAEAKGYYVERLNYITDSVIKESYLLYSPDKSDNDLRFDGIQFNNMFKPKQDCCFIKYSDEQKIRFLKHTGSEKYVGKFSWGAGDNYSFLKENYLFSFEG